jgi:hypothetical protein
MKECEKLPKYPRFANLARSVLALHVPAQNRNSRGIASNLACIRPVAVTQTPRQYLPVYVAAIVINPTQK